MSESFSKHQMLSFNFWIQTGLFNYRQRRLAWLLAVVLSLVLATGVAAANLFSLDPSFGVNGRLISDLDSEDSGYAIALQADGKIVAAGYTGVNRNFALIRYRPDGSLDKSFGLNGKVSIDFDGLFNEAHALAVQPDGKIVVAGFTGFFLTDFSLARYTSDGRPDVTFGDNGLVTTDFGSNELIFALAVQTDGKIVVAGVATSEESNDNFILARYTGQGHLDLDFGDNGRILTDFGGYDTGEAMALQSDGKIIAAGSTTTLNASDIALARYSSAGNLDFTFSGDGKLTTDFGGFESGHALAIQTDGKIVTAGSNGSDFVLARYTPEGRLDTTFDGDGKLATDMGGNDEGLALAIQADGKIVAAGKSCGSVGCDFALARYTGDGHLDPTFDGDGKLSTDFETTSESRAIAIQPDDGKIIAAGESCGGRFPMSCDFGLARYRPNGSPDPSFDGDGKLSTDFGGNNEGHTVAIQPSDGKIVVTGTWERNSVLVRYNDDGSYDLVELIDVGNGEALVIQSDNKFITAGWGNLPGLDGIENDFLLARYNSDGSLDETFDEGNDYAGVATDFGADDKAYTVVIQPDGKIVAAGSSGGNFALARYNSDGQLDPSFNSDGLLTSDLGGDDRAYALAIQPDGKIVAAGSSGGNFALARYNSDGQPDPSFNSDGLLTSDFGGSDEGRAMVLQSDGKVVVAGSSQGDFALARYNHDGSLDGKVTTDFGGDDRAEALALDAGDRLLAAGSTSVAGSADFALARYGDASLTFLPFIVKTR